VKQLNNVAIEDTRHKLGASDLMETESQYFSSRHGSNTQRVAQQPNYRTQDSQKTLKLPMKMMSNNTPLHHNSSTLRDKVKRSGTNSHRFNLGKLKTKKKQALKSN
jgi:hypothetical protein